MDHGLAVHKVQPWTKRHCGLGRYTPRDTQAETNFPSQMTRQAIFETLLSDGLQPNETVR